MLDSPAKRASDNANRLAPGIIIGMEMLRQLCLYYAAGEPKLSIAPASMRP